MNIEKAKEIVQVGFAWANWTSEQKEAFRTLLLEVEKSIEEVNQIRKENVQLTDRLYDLQQEQAAQKGGQS